MTVATTRPARTSSEDTNHLFQHQRYGSEMMQTVPCLGIAYQTGTGKSATALDFLYHLARTMSEPRLLVICPASLIPKWWGDVETMRTFEEYKEDGIDYLKNHLTILSFSRFYRTEKTKHTVRHRDGTVTEEEKEKLVLRDEAKGHWDAIIIDESHRIGNRQSKQTHASWLLDADRRYAMTGTPISGGGEQEDWSKLYGQIKFLNHDRWRSWKEFAEEFILDVDYWGRPCRWRDDACRSLMSEYFIFARLSDCFDMPTREDIIIPCDLLERRAYDDFKHKNYEPYGLRVRKSGITHTKLLQLCAGAVKVDADSDDVISFRTSKTDALATLLEGTDDKVVIFCMYRSSIDRVRAVCEKHGKTVIFAGDTGNEVIEDFRTGDARYLVFSYSKGVEGLNLQSSHTMVFYDPTPCNRDLEQAQARIYRKGQTEHCLFYYLSTTGTIDAEVFRRVLKGETLTTETLEELAQL